MKLSENEVEDIIRKVYKDLRLEHNEKYPIKCHFHKKDKDSRYKVDYWSGFFDYSELLDEDFRTYSNDPIIVNDETGQPISILIFPSETSIKIDQVGNFKWGNEM